MRVFLYYSGYPNTGGPTTRLRTWARELHRHGVHVTLGGGTGIWEWPIGADTPKRTVWWRIPSAGRLLRWGVLPVALWCWPHRRQIAKGRYDIVHCVGGTVAVPTMLQCARSAGARTLYTETSSARQAYPKGFDIIWSVLDGVHAASSVVLDRLLESRCFRGKRYVFAGATDRIPELLPKPGRSSHMAGYVGHMTAHKNVERLVQVWSRVVGALPAAHLHLFGEGDQMGHLRDFVASAGMRHNVTFHGYERDLKAIYCQFALLIILSEEGQCFAVSEALGSGREVLLLDHGCFGELYARCHAAHMVHPAASDDELAAAIVSLLTDEELLSPERRSAARSWYEERFSPQAAGRNLLACYRDLLEG